MSPEAHVMKPTLLIVCTSCSRLNYFYTWKANFESFKIHLVDGCGACYLSAKGEIESRRLIHSGLVETLSGISQERQDGPFPDGEDLPQGPTAD